MKSPSTATVKRLFAVSGNLCAFPKCSNPLVDELSGKVTGEICHIKAKSPDGPRFEAVQTDEERHGFDNLILLCPIHHQVVDDDPEAYSYERLQKMKSTHEAAQPNTGTLSDAAANTLINNIQGNTVANGSIIVNQNQMGGQVAHSITNNGPQPRQFTQAAANQLIANLKKLPPETITLFCLMGDTEGYQLVMNLKSVLESAGWKIEKVLQSLFNGPVKGVHVETPADTAGVRTLILWLQAVGFNPQPKLGAEIPKLGLVVGGNIQ